MAYEEIEDIRKEYETLNFKLNFMCQSSEYTEYMELLDRLELFSDMLSFAGYTYIGGRYVGEWV